LSHTRVARIELSYGRSDSRRTTTDSQRNRIRSIGRLTRCARHGTPKQEGWTSGKDEDDSTA